ncbi:hypothetical protein E2C01_006047 [Portunus trituberculatus]|uniref:Uncharacterized protein n=1 Tax=Portunus trituberculatus TaxID=210409 RepID=A0A5B7CY81_PORTR|nr:hypothetical protein [Portunus trituberculatus]
MRASVALLSSLCSSVQEGSLHLNTVWVSWTLGAAAVHWMTPVVEKKKKKVNELQTPFATHNFPLVPPASGAPWAARGWQRRSYCDQARLCEALDEAGRAGSGRKPYITKANVARICATLVGPVPPPPRNPPRRHISTGVSVNLMVSGPLPHARCPHISRTDAFIHTHLIPRTTLWSFSSLAHASRDSLIEVLEVEAVHTKWYNYVATTTEVFHHYFPAKSVTVHPCDVPWMTHRIKRFICQRK